MSMEQAIIIEEQQKTIKRQQRRIAELERITETAEEVKVGEISNHISELLNSAEPVAIRRHGYREAYIVPAVLIEGRA